MILKQGHKYRAMPHDGKLIDRIYRGGRCYYKDSPYSPEATQALKAQFPTQWPTIRDYGFAHPEIVGYMNAYAPEDAKIAYSLVEGIGWRSVVSSGSRDTRFVTTYKPSNNTKVQIGYRATEHNSSSQWNALFGSGNSANSNNFSIFLSTSGGYSPHAYWWSIGGKDLSTGKVATVNAYHVLEVTDKYLKEDGVTLYSTTSSTINDNHPMWILGVNRDGSPAEPPIKGGVQFVKIDDGAYWFIPFKRNGEMELLDIVTHTLATRVGTFTEIIEDKE